MKMFDVSELPYHNEPVDHSRRSFALQWWLDRRRVARRRRQLEDRDPVLARYRNIPNHLNGEPYHGTPAALPVATATVPCPPCLSPASCQHNGYCPMSGQTERDVKRTCKNCGSSDGTKFCTRCGTRKEAP